MYKLDSVPRLILSNCILSIDALLAEKWHMKLAQDSWEYQELLILEKVHLKHKEHVQEESWLEYQQQN